MEIQDRTDIKYRPLHATEPALSPVNEALILQMQHEMTNYYTYKNFSGMCDCKGFYNAAKFFEKQAADELVHFNKIFSFCCDRVGFKPKLEAIPAMEFSDKVLMEMISESFNLELKTTQSLMEKQEVAFVEDRMAFNLLSELVNEQREEEKLFGDLLQRFITFGDTPQGIMLLEQEMANL